MASIDFCAQQPHNTCTKLPQRLCPLVLVCTVRLLYGLCPECDCHNSTKIFVHCCKEMYGFVWYCTDFDFCATIFLGICACPYNYMTHLFYVPYGSNKCCYSPQYQCWKWPQYVCPLSIIITLLLMLRFSLSLIDYENLSHTHSLVSLSQMISAFTDFT